jgi:hypothetical protein
MHADLIAFYQSDVLKQETNHAFLLAIGRSRISPKSRKVARQRSDTRFLCSSSALRSAWRSRSRCSCASFSARSLLFHSASSVSATRRLGGHVHVPALRQIGFVTGALNLFATHPVHFVETDLNLLLHGQGEIERHGRHRLN